MDKNKGHEGIDRQSFREAKKGRNWAVFSAIFGFCILLFIITIVRML